MVHVLAAVSTNINQSKLVVDVDEEAEKNKDKDQANTHNHETNNNNNANVSAAEEKPEAESVSERAAEFSSLTPQTFPVYYRTSYELFCSWFEEFRLRDLNVPLPDLEAPRNVPRRSGSKNDQGMQREKIKQQREISNSFFSPLSLRFSRFLEAFLGSL